MNILSSINHIKYTYTSPTPRFTPFQFTIATTSGSANFTGTANQYPITFNSSTTSNTYGLISNFTSATASNNNFTIYVKGKGLNSSSYASMPTLLNFVNTNTGFTTNNTFMLLGGAGQNNHNKITYMFRVNNNLLIYILTGNILANINDFYHTFMRFDYNSAVFNLYIYSKTNTLLYQSGNISYPTNIFSSLGIFAFSKITGNTTSCSNVTIANAGWYNYLLTTAEMSSIVKLSPN